MQNAQAIYKQYGFNEDSERVAQAIRDVGPAVVDNMKSVSTTFEVPIDELDKYLNQLTSGDLEAFVGNVAREFIERKGQTEQLVRDIAKKGTLNVLDITAGLCSRWEAGRYDRRGRRGHRWSRNSTNLPEYGNDVAVPT